MKNKSKVYKPIWPTEDESNLSEEEKQDLAEYRAFPIEKFRVKQIGRDFELIRRSNGFWAIQFYDGSGGKVSLGASDVDIALWKSREAMYAIFAKIYEGVKDEHNSTASWIKKLLEESKLDQAKYVS